MDPAQQIQPTNGFNTGDNSKISGDQPIANPSSQQIVQEKQTEEASKMTSVNSAQILNTTIPVAKPGEKSESYDQIRKLGEQVEKAVIPEDLKAILNERIARLALIRSGAGFMSSTYVLEYEGTSRYVNWVTGLPWDKKSQDMLDLVKARAILDRNHYGLTMLKQRVLEHIASLMLSIKNYGPQAISHSPILCFVGLAGTGKTTFAMSVAESLGRHFERIPCGGR